ncbi:MAG: tetratricopeptide repeat protein [Alphaproteobacteria bacterium]|nr:tetratricopeptide repeat protein [Alphaproteobacteria bacterium]
MRTLRTLIFVAVASIVLALGAAGATKAENSKTAPLLNNLFAELKVVKNSRSALELEQRIWLAWYQSGDPDIDRLMRQARIALGERRMKEALEVADEVVKRAPDYSEGWNFRATALFIDNRLEASMRDVAKVLTLEPRHFGALSGSALILLRKGKKRAALKAIKHALEIHPYLRGAANIIRQAGGAEEGDPI